MQYADKKKKRDKYIEDDKFYFSQLQSQNHNQMW